ncbi:MAG: [FeFe] hydrogenase H-cluster maturation GTPase HydF [Clostridia bacterium]|nr:[FeFe] hydrogenase H-cluster maturation GTPase HydF [Clostridia bacterium]
MGLNSTPNANRVHISFFGLRNAGKSSLVNAVTNQDIAVVSNVKGTTTDPVSKSMELLPLGPVLITDTPGFDDEGELGEKRVQKTMQVLSKTDIAVLVSDATRDLCDLEKELIEVFKAKKIPYVIAFNKCDIGKAHSKNEKNVIYTSATEKVNIEEFKNLLASFNNSNDEKRLLGDLISKEDVVVLITPIDESAPKGRMILPQVQAIRDILDSDAICVVTKENTYEKTLQILGDRVKLAVCDSQVFDLINKLTPPEIKLTSFSILMARFKGYLKEAFESIKVIDSIKDDDVILISEGCSHHRQCGDIGTVKLPNLIKKYTGKNPVFEFTQGTEFPNGLEKYSLVIHCGGCMLNEREVQSRMETSLNKGVPFSNYGIAIAYMNGIIKRSTEIFPELQI